MNLQQTGNFIAQLRKEKNYTQQELADLLHVSDKAISRWETGRGFPDLSNLEPLSEVLDVSVAELLKGERMKEEVPLEEVDALHKDTLRSFRTLLHKRELRSLLIGFLASLLLLCITITHLRSPQSIPYDSNLLSIEVTQEGKILALANRKISGFEVDHVNYEGNHSVHLSAYSTLWDQLFQKKVAQVIQLGDTSEIDEVYYYPGTTEDVLLYQSERADTSGGVETLPRLIYNFWILIGALFSIAGIVLTLLQKSKERKKSVLKFTLLPVSLTLSMLLILTGHTKALYDAPYYFSGILLSTAVIYAIAYLAIFTRKEN